MKLMHTVTTTLNTREFNKLTDKIADAIYELNQDISELYDIHINYIEDSWRIDFVPLDDDFPVIKVDTYTKTDDSGAEILMISPKSLSDIPKSIDLRKQSEGYDTCLNYVVIFECLLSLYDFEYKLN